MKLKKIRIAGALTAVAVVVTTQAAFATNTVSVDGATTPVGSVTFNAPAITSTVFESNYGDIGTCLDLDVVGYFLRGASGPIGTKIGAITGLDSIDCTISDLLLQQYFYKVPNSPAWAIHTLETPTKAQRYVKVEIRSVDNLRINNTSLTPPWTCAVNMTGKVEATIDTQLDQIVINTPSLTGGLTKTNPLLVDALPASGAVPNTTISTCAGWYYDGDVMSLVSTLQLDHNIEF